MDDYQGLRSQSAREDREDDRKKYGVTEGSKKFIERFVTEIMIFFNIQLKVFSTNETEINNLRLLYTSCDFIKARCDGKDERGRIFQKVHDKTRKIAKFAYGYDIKEVRPHRDPPVEHVDYAKLTHFEVIALEALYKNLIDFNPKERCTAVEFPGTTLKDGEKIGCTKYLNLHHKNYSTYDPSELGDNPLYS